MSAQQEGAAAAQAALDQGDNQRALQLWQAVWEADPADRQAALGAVRALAALNKPHALMRWVEALEQTEPRLADQALRIAARQLPKDVRIGVAYCRAAERGGDPRQAESRWWDLRKRVPRKVAAHVGYIDCMLAQGRFNEAERAALSAIRFVGQKPDLLEAHARVAEAQNDWAEATRRWALLHDAAPEHAHAAARRAEAARKSAEPGSAPAPLPDVPPIPPIAELTDAARHALRRRLMGFESIGRNCEFGLLQRKFEAEPLGLLRFSTTRPPTLLKLLRTRFAGIGDPAQNEVVLVKNEYRLRHLPSGWRMHTHLTGQADPATVLRDQCRHTGFLRTKLIRDLEGATKIFVYQMAAIDDAEIAEIYAALQEYGPNMLMVVRLSTREHPAGSVHWPQPRLMVAHIDRQGQEFTGAGWDISVDYWLHFCSLAEARREGIPTAELTEQAVSA